MSPYRSTQSTVMPTGDEALIDKVDRRVHKLSKMRKVKVTLKDIATNKSKLQWSTMWMEHKLVGSALWKQWTLHSL